MSSSRHTLPIWLALLAALLAAFWLRVSLLDDFPPGISNDEGVNLVDGAHFALSGRLPLGEDFGSEPLRPVAGAFTSLLFGNSVFVHRYASALWGFLALAGAFWSCRQCYFDQRESLRNLAGLCAVVVAATALGHITISRSVYRAAPLTFCLSMSVGFACRAFRACRLRDFIGLAFFLAFGSYSYVTGLFAILALPPLALRGLLSGRRKFLRCGGRLVICGIVLSLLLAPLAALWLLQPEAILARASDVSRGDGAVFGAVKPMLEQYFLRGDENPQYNVADAPLLSPQIAPLFALGLLALLVRFRQTSALLIVALLVLTALPTMLTNEVSQGLRMYGAFAVIPLVVAAGLLAMQNLLLRLPWSRAAADRLMLALLAAVFAWTCHEAARTYFGFWQSEATDARKWRIHDADLSPGQWFFQSDRRRLFDWITAQGRPILLPRAEIEEPAARAMLFSQYPLAQGYTEPISLPADTLVVWPWSLAKGGYDRDARHFALLHNDAITILPPVSSETLIQLKQAFANAADLQPNGDGASTLARYARLDAGSQPEFATAAASNQPLAAFDGALQLRGWQGPRVIDAPDRFIYDFDFAVSKPVSHRYAVFLQLLTPQWERLAGTDQFLHRYLYPTHVWNVNESVSTTALLELAELPPPGAYRLAAGAWYRNGGHLPAQSFVGDSAGNMASIGWVKIPQADAPRLPDNATVVSATFADALTLSHVRVAKPDAGHIEVDLYWTSLRDFPEIDATIFVHATDRSGTLVSQNDKRPWNGRYPTFIWGNGEQVKTTHQLRLSQTDGIHLSAGMYTQPDLARLPATKDGLRLPGDSAILGSLDSLLVRD